MAKAPAVARAAARKGYEQAKGAPIGQGKRFAALAASARASGARNPEAVAAAAGRKAHGAQRMAQMAAAGRSRARKVR